MISIIRQAKNDYYEASDSVLQIGHLSGSNAVQQATLETSDTRLRVIGVFYSYSAYHENDTLELLP